MAKERPVINHIALIIDGEWSTRTFLPLFDDLLVWAEDVGGEKGCPSGCPLDNHLHPMVSDELKPNTYHKLCTLTVIRAGLATREEIVGDRR